TDLIEYLRLTAQGEEKESVGRNRGFLTHLDLSTSIKASGFSIAISLNADMLNYDVALTPDRFKEVTAYNDTLAYIKNHQNDKAMDYSGLK
ncbi:MAG: hypothetical protein MJ239_06800, partial [Bacilli bacterium]|nr:hypothetical protein [Bacilli bacterium]